MNISDTHHGLLLAGATALCWAGSSIAFSRSSRSVGSLAVNIIRLAFAIAFFSIYGYINRGSCLPADATATLWGWLLLSGFIGFFLGDLFLFRSFNLIGVRLSMLLMSLAPIAAALTGWLWLGNTISPRQLCGMAVTISGVMIVIMDSQKAKAGVAGNKKSHVATGVYVRGIVYAFLGAIGQGVGVVTGKVGMIADSTTNKATYVTRCVKTFLTNLTKSFAISPFLT